MKCTTSKFIAMLCFYAHILAATSAEVHRRSVLLPNLKYHARHGGQYLKDSIWAILKEAGRQEVEYSNQLPLVIEAEEKLLKVSVEAEEKAAEEAAALKAAEEKAAEEAAALKAIDEELFADAFAAVKAAEEKAAEAFAALKAAEEKAAEEAAALKAAEVKAAAEEAVALKAAEEKDPCHVQDNTIISTIDCVLENIEKYATKTGKNHKFRSPGSLILHMPNMGLIGSLTNLDILPQNLEYLNLSHNQLSGELGDFTNLSKLRYLYLENNQFIGDISAIGNLTDLVDLHIHDNQFSGSIEPLKDLKQLNYLDLSNNLFRGGIAALKDLKQLEYLNLSQNLFNGVITPIGNLTNLRYLYLNDNQFIGDIAAIGNLLHLEYVLIYDTKLKGEVPENIVKKLDDPNFHLIMDRRKFTSTGFTGYKREIVNFSREASTNKWITKLANLPDKRKLPWHKRHKPEPTKDRMNMLRKIRNILSSVEINKRILQYLRLINFGSFTNEDKKLLRLKLLRKFEHYLYYSAHNKSEYIDDSSLENRLIVITNKLIMGETIRNKLRDICPEDSSEYTCDKCQFIVENHINEKKLYPYNISCKINTVVDDNHEKVLMIHNTSLADYNGAFSDFYTGIKCHQENKRSYRILGGGKKNILEKLKEILSETNSEKYDIVSIHGHGSEFSIELDQAFELFMDSSYLGTFWNAIRQSSKVNANVYLDACETAHISSQQPSFVVDSDRLKLISDFLPIRNRAERFLMLFESGTTVPTRLPGSHVIPHPNLKTDFSIFGALKAGLHKRKDFHWMITHVLLPGRTVYGQKSCASMKYDDKCVPYQDDAAYKKTGIPYCSEDTSGGSLLCWGNIVLHKIESRIPTWTPLDGTWCSGSYEETGLGTFFFLNKTRGGYVALCTNLFVGLSNEKRNKLKKNLLLLNKRVNNRYTTFEKYHNWLKWLLDREIEKRIYILTSQPIPIPGHRGGLRAPVLFGSDPIQIDFLTVVRYGKVNHNDKDSHIGHTVLYLGNESKSPHHFKMDLRPDEDYDVNYTYLEIPQRRFRFIPHQICYTVKLDHPLSVTDVTSKMREWWKQNFQQFKTYDKNTANCRMYVDSMASFLTKDNSIQYPSNLMGSMKWKDLLKENDSQQNSLVKCPRKVLLLKNKQKK